MKTGQAVAARNRRPRGQHPKPRDPDGRRRHSRKLPEYLEAHHLSLENELPSLHIREVKGSEPRSVLVHPELRAALTSALEFGDVGEGDRLIRASRASADRRMKPAASMAVELGEIPPGRRVSNNTLRHSYARHLLLHGRPISFISRWLGDSAIHPMLIYLELVPDPTGSLASVP